MVIEDIEAQLTALTRQCESLKSSIDAGVGAGLFVVFSEGARWGFLTDRGFEGMPRALGLRPLDPTLKWTMTYRTRRAAEDAARTWNETWSTKHSVMTVTVGEATDALSDALSFLICKELPRFKRLLEIEKEQAAVESKSAAAQPKIARSKL